ncbi:hypothetical protein [Candidatus Mycobacterium methanotrophicum]|uniref:hypothetical protein n=1 Tax=Candidatus Mycobacterium methanotrophicum TaxID=2943498 RepID=UPI004032D95D
MDDYRFAYLVTVDDDYRVHTVTVEPELRERAMKVGPARALLRRNASTPGFAKGCLHDCVVFAEP